MKSSSAPLDVPSGEVLKEQRSAPSHLVSLDHNEVPPFKRTGKLQKPKLLLWTFTDRQVTKNVMEIAKLGHYELRRTFEQLSVNHNFVANSDISEKQFISSLLMEALRYGTMQNFNVKKMSALLAIYVNSHAYFKSYYWMSPSTMWAYFKELVFRHSIDDSPEGEEIFDPAESYDILSHFHTIYMCNLPLIHIRVFAAHHLKLTWPFHAH